MSARPDRRPAGEPAGVLAGQVALVTGGAVRVGAAVCRAVAQAGADVVVHHRTSAPEAESMVRELRERGGGAWSVRGDLGDVTGAPSLVAEASRMAGRPVHLLVNNASVFPEDDWRSLEWPALEECMRVNAWAPFALMRALADGLASAGGAGGAGAGGAVVNLLDTRLVDLDRRHLGYHFSKALLREVTDAGARVLAPRVRVNGVAPGPVLEPVGSGDGGYLERMAPRMPLGCTPAPADVADAVVHLLANRSVTGQVLHVDGGRHLGRPIEDAAPRP